MLLFIYKISNKMGEGVGTEEKFRDLKSLEVTGSNLKLNSSLTKGVGGNYRM